MVTELSSTLNISHSGTLPQVPFLAIKEKILGKKYDLSIAFVSPAKAQALNIEHRNKEYVPNTLSFAYDNMSGEIVLCMSAMKKQNKAWGMDIDTYVTFIIIHSMLHLVGMDHGDIMERKEKQLLTFFTSHSIPNETIHRSRH